MFVIVDFEIIVNKCNLLNIFYTTIINNYSYWIRLSKIITICQWQTVLLQ